MTDEYFMKQALAEAQEACNEDEVPVGGVLVCEGRIIARAHNMVERLNDVSAHAEMQLLTAGANVMGGKYLNECTLYVTVEPCPMCAAALAWGQLKRIVYGATDEKRGAHLFSPSLYHPKTEIVGGVMADECASIMKSFFQKKR